MHIRLKLLAMVISIAVMPNTALAQGGPPPGGGGGSGPATTLSSLGCGPTEIARVNGADEWECSGDLTANEAATTAAQATADVAVGAAAAAQSTADTALGEAFIAQSTAATALNAASDAQFRVGALEAQNLDGRVSALEGMTRPFERIIIVSPIGATAMDNGLVLLDAVAEAAAAVPAPSASDPILILVEPGVYNIDPDTISLPNHVSLRGAGEGLTRIVGRASSTSTVNVVIARENALISDLSIEFVGPFGSGISVAGQNIIIQHVSVSGPSTNAVNNGISAGAGTSAKVENVSIAGFNVAARVANSDITIANLNALGNTNGVFVLGGGDVEIRDSLLQILNTGSGCGLLASDADTEATVWGSQLGNVCSQISALARIYGSRMRFVRTTQTGGNGFAEVANSQISDGASTTQASCVFSHDLALTPLDAACQ